MRILNLFEFILILMETEDQELQKRRMYLIEFRNGPEIETIIASAKRLRAYGRRNEGISVKIDREESGRRKNKVRLLVTGNISREQVREVMRQCEERYEFKYGIISNPYK